MSIEPSPHLVQNYGRFPIRFVRGAGCWLYDENDRPYLDCLSGIAVNALGHGHPALVAAIREQAGRLMHTSNLFHVPPQEELAAKLCEHSFADRVYFCNSGAEANECAIKIARLWSSQIHGGAKPRLIAAEHSFHGRTIGALSITGTEAYRRPFAPLLEVTFVPYGDIEALQQAMGLDVAAIFLEPLQGEGGVHPAPAGYLARARALCDEYRALLMLDEVQTGIGRCGRFLCHEYDGVKPDVAGLAKGLGGGVPIGASIMSEECALLLKPGTHASTFGGNHLACAAGCVVVEEVLKPGFLEHVVETGERIRKALGELFGDRVVEIRGRGLLIGVQLPEAPAELLKACQAEGLICGAAGGNVLRLAPPLVFGQEEVDELLARLGRALDSLG